MNGYLLIFIFAVLMFVQLWLRRKLYAVTAINVLGMTVGVAGMGLLGTYIMFFLENGFWYGKSFFGAVLFFPILLLPLTYLFRIKLLDFLDYATPPGLSILVVYKINCKMLNCCSGRVLWFSEAGIPTYFPSQMVEAAAAALITLLLLVLERTGKWKKQLYPLCLIFYGTSRFVLNFFRWDQNKYFLGMTSGQFWSVISLLIGTIWLIIYRKNSVPKE